MRRNSIDVIDKSELVDFKAALSKHGLSEADFELSSKEDALPAGQVSPETGRITVKNKRTGAEWTYKAGHGSKWVAEFEQDLKAGQFS